MKKFLLILVVTPIVLGYFSLFVVDEREQVVITQFGKVVGEPLDKPGLKIKVPFIQTANRFPKNLQEWDGDRGEIPTLDKTYIWVDTFARWKIVNPVNFFQTVNNIPNAHSRLNEIINPAVRNQITSHSLIEAVRNTNRQLDTIDVDDLGMEETDTFNITTGRQSITKKILVQAAPKLVKFGIELVDVKIKRINYEENVQESVYGRMIAERKQIAEKFRSEGKGEANKIIGEKDRELKRITSEAYKTAQEIKGKADAEAADIYAQAYQADPEFYSFVRSLDIYEEAFLEKSSVFLSGDSAFLKYLRGYDLNEGIKTTAPEKPAAGID